MVLLVNFMMMLVIKKREKLLVKNIYRIRFIVCVRLNVSKIIDFGIYLVMVFDKNFVKNLEKMVVIGFKVVKSVV